MLRRNGPVVKSVESVLSLWGERFVEEVGLESGVKERERELRMVITSIVERRYDGVGMLLAAGEWTESKRDDTGISDVDR